MREQTMKHRVGKRSKAIPWDNDGEQSDPNVRCTLVHVGPTMGGALTQVEQLSKQNEGVKEGEKR